MLPHPPFPNGEHEPDVFTMTALDISRPHEFEILVVHQDLSNEGNGSLAISPLPTVPPGHHCTAIQWPDALLPLTPRPDAGTASAHATTVVHGETVLTRRPCGCTFAVESDPTGAALRILAQLCSPCAARDARDARAGGPASRGTDPASPTHHGPENDDQGRLP